MYLLHRLRGMGLTARVYEAGDGVGGTWYWNRYPGARCDAESLAYSYSFSNELENEWNWSERYATQPEILRYAEHVADKFDLKRDIRFERRVTSARFDDRKQHLDGGNRSRRPRDGAVLRDGDRMSVGAAGSDDRRTEGLRTQPLLREQVAASAGEFPRPTRRRDRHRVVGDSGDSGDRRAGAHLAVFQRTPNFSVPACNGPLDPGFVDAFKANYPEHRLNHRLGMGSGFGDLQIEPHPGAPPFETSAGKSRGDSRGLLEKYWQIGGANFIGAIADTIMNQDTNRIVADFVRDKIRAIVKDPATADALCPTSHPIGTKRICVDSATTKRTTAPT